jgi:hypothetical protein
MSKGRHLPARTLLIHGARAVICQRADACSWISEVVNRRNKKVAAVALGGGAAENLNGLISGLKVAPYWIGLRAPSEILIGSSLYQRM